MFNLTKISYVLVFGASIANLATGIIEPTVAPYLEVLGSSSEQIGVIISGITLLNRFSLNFAMLSILVLLNHTMNLIG